MCVQCEATLTVAYEFKKQCEHTDTKLRELAGIPLHKVKQETFSRMQTADDEISDVCDGNDNDFDSESDAKHKRKFKSDSDTEYLPQRKRTKKTRNEITLHTCTLCSKHFRTKKSLNLHMVKHKDAQIHACPVCELKFTKSDLEKHNVSEHLITSGEKHYCNSCGVLFNNMSTLLRHRTEIHELEGDDLEQENDGDPFDEFLHMDDEGGNASEKKNYLCKFCNKTMSTYNGYRIHLRRHTGEDMADCKVCIESIFLQQLLIFIYLIGMFEEIHKNKPFKTAYAYPWH